MFRLFWARRSSRVIIKNKVLCTPVFWPVAIDVPWFKPPPLFQPKRERAKYICSFFLVINPSKLTVLLEFCSQKRSCFSDQIVVAHNYLSFLSRQMETTICSFLSVTNEMLHQHFLYNT